MSRLLSKWWILLLPVIAAAFFVGASLFFYRGSYTPPPDVTVAYEEFTPPTHIGSRLTEVPTPREGLLLVDNVHVNGFRVDELGILSSRVADRGYSVEFLGDRDFLFFFPEERLNLMREKLPRADSFAIVLPRRAYTDEEIDLVKLFVAKGGRLLLIGDPGRSQNINGVADSFGTLFEAGYLYNVKEHDLNFRNILIKDFRPDEVTDGLEQIALYTAGSIKSSGVALAFTDENTYSSLVERQESFSPVVKSADGHVLAIADFTFMSPPRNATLDNDRFISNIADFLTGGERTFDLRDYPHFFKREVEILLGQASLFEVGTRFRRMLSDDKIDSEIRGTEDLSEDIVFLGTYRDASAVAQYLAVAGVQINDTIRTPFTPDISAAGTAIILAQKEGSRWVLVVLGYGEEELIGVVDRLESGEFRSGLVSDLLGIYQVSSRVSEDTSQQGE